MKEAAAPQTKAEGQHLRASFTDKSKRTTPSCCQSKQPLKTLNTSRCRHWPVSADLSLVCDWSV